MFRDSVSFFLNYFNNLCLLNEKTIKCLLCVLAANIYIIYVK